jgi:predicted dehydrogenase
MKGIASNPESRIAFLCDVDDRQAVKSRENFPAAKYYKDFRVMLDKEAKNIDAVSVTTLTILTRWQPWPLCNGASMCMCRSH